MTAAANNSSLMFASMDTDATILVRDLRNSADVVSTHSKHGGGSFETGFILYNSRVHNELFVFVNNELEVYDADGTVIQRAEFDANIVYALQDEDVLIVAYQTGGLAVYDWNKDRIVEEMKGGLGPIKSIAISDAKCPKADRVLVCGGEKGELIILR